MGLITYILGIVVIACIVIPLLGRLLEGDSADNFGSISPTTNIEYTTLTIMEILQKNKKHDSFDKFLKDLKRKGIVNQKIDIKFYKSLTLAQRNGTLTKEYIKNKLE